MHLLSADPREFLHQDGELFVPIETTALTRGFSEAWKAGAAELARFEKNPAAIKRVDVRAAWKKYPPIDLSAMGAKSERRVEGVRDEVVKVLASIETERRAALEVELAKVEKALAKSGALALINRRAVLMAQLGRNDARALLEKIVREHPEDATALANLGNMHLLEGRPKDALAQYSLALQRAKGAAIVDIHLDAALAAFVAGDDAAFTDHVVECLEAGAKERVAALSRAGAGTSGGSRGGDQPSLRMRDLSLAIDRAFQKSGRESPLQPEEKQAGEVSEPVGRFVVWL
jgi:tetratricopeptide (TPR) repeat protein